MPEIMLTKGYESLPRRTGAMLVHSIITKAGIFALIPDSPRGARGPDRTFTDKEILELAITSFAAAQPDFTDVNEFHSDPKFYGVFLGSHGKLPAESTVRTRLDAIADKLKKHGYKVLMVANADMLKYYNIDPGALYNGFVPVDLDVSPLRNDRCKKEGVGLTYKQEVGYAPMFCYIGTHGLPIAAELREGTQHCQKGTPELLKEIIPVALSLTDKPLLFRFDSGNDAEENMRLLIGNPQIRFLIKRNFRRICKDDEALRLMNCATKVERPRDGKVVYTGTTAKTFAYTEEDGTKSSMTVRVVFQITERTSTWYGQQLIVPEREIDEWFTNLEMEEASDDEVIELYHDHGTSEQYHSEYKSDLDIEQLPSGKFNTNALILLLSTISYNCLRIIELLAREMPADSPIHFRDTKRRRLRTIIENLILIPSHFTTHARQMKLSLGKSNPWADVFIYVRNRISSIVASHRNAPPALAPVG